MQVESACLLDEFFSPKFPFIIPPWHCQSRPLNSCDFYDDVPHFFGSFIIADSREP